MEKRFNIIFENKNFNIIRDLILLVTFIITIVALFSYPVNIIIVIIFSVVSIILILISISMYLWFSKTKIPISSRSDFTNTDLKKHIDESSKSIKILCIFLTWSEKLIPWIFEKLQRDQSIRIELLLVKRKRKPSDISYIRMREEDELKRKQYVPEINRTLWGLFTNLFDMHRNHKGVIGNLEVKEYDFMPALCMYIFDNQKLIFGPYIAKPCDDIPMMEINAPKKMDDLTSDNCLAFSELMKHYEILSGRDFYGNKDYPFRFCYYDGTNNISIHLMIENNVQQLNDILTPRKRLEFLDFLIGKTDTFEDNIMADLKEDRNEGRFDAVLRHISDLILNVRQQKPPDPDNWLEELLIIMGMAKRSADYVIKGHDEYNHSKRLKDLSSRLKLLKDHLNPQEIDPDWLLIIKDLSRALDEFNKSEKSIKWITELQQKITEKYGKRVGRIE